MFTCRLAVLCLASDLWSWPLIYGPGVQDTEGDWMILQPTEPWGFFVGMARKLLVTNRAVLLSQSGKARVGKLKHHGSTGVVG